MPALGVDSNRRHRWVKKRAEPFSARPIAQLPSRIGPLKHRSYKSYKSYKSYLSSAVQRVPFPSPMSVPLNKLSLDSLGPLDWYRMIRDQIQHEDNLIVQRLAWLMAAQSFFFTGYAIMANASPSQPTQLLARPKPLLLNMIPVVTCLSDLLIYGSVMAG